MVATMPISIFCLYNRDFPKECFLSNVEINKINCFYFCIDFYQAFRKGEIVEDSVVLNLYPCHSEIIACCCLCH